ncbi:MAG: tetratricopeptide repeat protein [Clostridiales bacterium]|nr:tetratricopeptide repeat protein [Clostridiales bacterium]
MDEQNKNNELGQENENEAVEKELEDIATLLQRELDKAKQESKDENALPDAVEDWENLVNQDENTLLSVEEENQKSETLAETENEEADDENDDDEKTDDENQDISQPEKLEEVEAMDGAEEKAPAKFSPLALFTAFAVIALTLFAVINFSNDNIANIKSVFEAEGYLRENKIISALNVYTTINQNTNSEYAVRRIFSLCYKNGYVSDALNFAETYKSYFNEPWNLKYKKQAAYTQKMMDTINELNPIVQQVASSNGDFDYDSVISQLDAYNQESGKYDKATIEYYKSYVSSLASKDAETQLNYLKACAEANPSIEWLYKPDMANCYRLLGNMDEAIKIVNELIARNVDDSDMYNQKIFLYRMNKDYDLAIKACNDAVEAFYDEKEESSSNYEAYRQYAIVYLLKGDYENAVSKAETANDMTLDEKVINTLALCYLANSDEEGYKEMVDLLKEYSVEIAQDVTDYKDGKKTLEQIFLEGLGDIQ